ncbi:MAG TPA: hypothetical protein VGG15_03655 [Terriglobales bacterium]
MKRRDRHMSDEDRLRFSDGELPLFSAMLARRHLAGCWDCRAKLRQSEEMISEILQLHHRTLDPQLPPASGSRALLKARLRQMQPRGGHFSLLRIPAVSRIAVAAIFFALLVGVLLTGQRWTRSNATSSKLAMASPVEPNRQLTPGATRFVNAQELCASDYSDDASDVSPDVREQVLKEYGLVGQSLSNYELDYLISPQLGGTEDASNLWPEPSAAATWNVKTKDALENRLHHMVCHGDLSLETAQQDLATDWVSAYKKYFHTAQPLRPL